MPLPLSPAAIASRSTEALKERESENSPQSSDFPVRIQERPLVMTWGEMPSILSAVNGLWMEMNEVWMRKCLELARLAASRDEVPVGALVVRDGVVISEAFNLREERQSPSGHAELMAIEEACRKLSSWRLVDCTLVTSLEPCVMCAGALIQARVGTLIYGALDPKGGAESVFGLLSSERHHHRVQVVSGVLEPECSLVLKEFFKKKRV